MTGRYDSMGLGVFAIVAAVEVCKRKFGIRCGL